jgi:hypothetical protein
MKHGELIIVWDNNNGKGCQAITRPLNVETRMNQEGPSSTIQMST